MSTDNKSHHYAHHYNSAEHEYETSKEGVWIFMTSEILMFGGLFVAYIIYNGLYPEVFVQGAKALDWRLGALNTVVLLTSSLTVVLAIHHLQHDNVKKAITNLWITVGCAAAFMVIKGFEYAAKISHGYLPGSMFSGDTHGLENPGLYYSFYFMMTGLHGLHVIIGAALVAWCAFRAKKGEFGSHHYTAVEGVGIFWHLVDLIWIFLFPLLYLV